MKASSKVDRRSYRLFRFLILLLMVISAAISVFRLSTSASSSPSFINSSSLPHRSQPFDTLFVEERKELESLKTHITSNGNRLQVYEETGIKKSLSCSSFIDGISVPTGDDEGILCCDRSHERTDVCYMKGDIRTNPHSSSINLLGVRNNNRTSEKIRPYTRKWEASVMNTIEEITLKPTKKSSKTTKKCDIHHKVPGLVFSTGGYTGNVYHEFNDGLLPLYITSRRFDKEVVFVVVEYHSWWEAKYGEVLKELSNYKIVEFGKNGEKNGDGKVHCFEEMIVGLRIHGELTIDSSLMPNGKGGIQDFQTLLKNSFTTAVGPTPTLPHRRLKLTILVRKNSRVLLNLKPIIRQCTRLGFSVEILNPKQSTPLSHIHSVISSSDALLAVHGAAMTHLLFLPPGSTLIQIVPIGLAWVADAFYGAPAKKMGIEYVEYRVGPTESSLSGKYERGSVVLREPWKITTKGWAETKKVYMDRQNVRVNVKRFGKVMEKVYQDIVKRSRIS